jgi:hypothetical protein
MVNAIGCIDNDCLRYQATHEMKGRKASNHKWLILRGKTQRLRFSELKGENKHE